MRSTLLSRGRLTRSRPVASSLLALTAFAGGSVGATSLPAGVSSDAPALRSTLDDALLISIGEDDRITLDAFEALLTADRSRGVSSAGVLEPLDDVRPVTPVPTPFDTAAVVLAAATSELEASDAEVEPVYVGSDGERIDAERIRAFLAGRGAPLADQAELFVAAGIEHDVDPRLVVGIAVAESAGGERLPRGSHNAWGWGGSGRYGLAHWGSWEASIDRFTERLGALYDTEHVGESFARTYCPPNWRWWLDTVTWVQGQI